MAKYVLQELPDEMTNGNKIVYPKMQTYSLHDFETVIEHMRDYSANISSGMIKAVFDALVSVMESWMPMGHNIKIDGLGVFSLSLEFTDNKAETDSQQETQEAGPKTKYHHVKAKGVNFKVDKKLVDDINRENDFERIPNEPRSPSPYSIEERLQRALQHIDKHGFISLQEYANLNRLGYSSASRELAKFVLDSHSGIKAKGAGSHKVWVSTSQKADTL